MAARNASVDRRGAGHPALRFQRHGAEGLRLGVAVEPVSHARPRALPAPGRTRGRLATRLALHRLAAAVRGPRVVVRDGRSRSSGCTRRAPGLRQGRACMAKRQAVRTFSNSASISRSDLRLGIAHAMSLHRSRSAGSAGCARPRSPRHHRPARAWPARTAAPAGCSTQRAPSLRSSDLSTSAASTGSGDAAHRPRRLRREAAAKHRKPRQRPALTVAEQAPRLLEHRLDARVTRRARGIGLPAATRCPAAVRQRSLRTTARASRTRPARAPVAGLRPGDRCRRWRALRPPRPDPGSRGARHARTGALHRTLRGDPGPRLQDTPAHRAAAATRSPAPAARAR